MISIIVPVYNAEPYIKQCIDSLIKQTYKSIEIIVIDDGSTDNSLKLLEEFALKDDRVRILKQKNSGVSSARNLGIQKANGEWITFVDGDDWVEPDMCKVAIEKAIDTKSDMVIWSYFKNYRHKQLELQMLPINSTVIINNKDVLLLKAIYGNYGNEKAIETISTGVVWGKLYKASLLKNNTFGFVNGLTRAQDTVFNINVIKKAEKIYYIAKSFYHYRITNTSTCSGTKFIEDTNKPFDLLLEHFAEFIRVNNYKGEYFDAFNLRTIQVIMWHLKHKYNNPSYNKPLTYRRKEILNLISRSPYKEALENVDTKQLPKKEKLLVDMFKKRRIISYLTILTLHEKYFSKKQRF